MKIGHSDVEYVNISALIEDLFGIDAAALAAMVPSPHMHDNDPALLGLQEFLRRVLLLTLQLRDNDTETLSVTSESHLGIWPDAPTARLANLMVSAVVNEWRPYRCLPFLSLEGKKASPADRPSCDERYTAMSIGEVLNEMRGLPEAQRPRREFSPRYPLSVVSLIKKSLRIEPRQLAARFYDRDDRIADAYAQDPEQQAQLGLAYMVSDAKYQYKIMRKRNIDRIRLMGEEDARIARRPSARMANMITVLSAALHADDQHVICFEPPKAPLANEEELLRTAARLVYLDHSFEAQEALELLCDRNVHFGSFDRFSRAEELLSAVGRECDPNQQQMPFTVAVQEHGFGAIEAAGRA